MSSHEDQAGVEPNSLQDVRFGDLRLSGCRVNRAVQTTFLFGLSMIPESVTGSEIC